ncbi:MAG: hypothetical protein K2Q18_00285, partial [Bdellovibrionales bacterium]|nr:hypothetical protein [Bdellovibrionales bacterium]
KCAYFSLAYRCENLMDYFSTKGLSEEDKKILNNIESLKMLQKKLFTLTISSANILTSEEVKQIIVLADASVERVSFLLKESSKGTTTQELLVLEYFSAAALRKTLEQANLIKPLK